MQDQQGRNEEMSKDGGKDKIFDEDIKPTDFKFDEKVARVFDDMVSRSVPMYDETMATALSLAANFAEPDSRVYDIGCSTGTLLLKFADIIDDRAVKLVGIDNSKPMIEQAQEKIAKTPRKDQIDIVYGNIEESLGLENASVIFMNYTLQFVRPLHREAVLKQIYAGLKPNGCLILVEKILGNDSLFNRLYIDLYYAYKQRVGYSDKEIKQKREALENVLIPYRLDENIELLQRCGFTSTDVFFKWYNWAGIIAVKN